MGNQEICYQHNATLCVRVCVLTHTLKSQPHRVNMFFRVTQKQKCTMPLGFAFLLRFHPSLSLSGCTEFSFATFFDTSCTTHFDGKFFFLFLFCLIQKKKNRAHFSFYALFLFNNKAIMDISFLCATSYQCPS